MIPRERMTSSVIWMSSDQLRGSWKTKMAEMGVAEKSTLCVGISESQSGCLVEV